MAKALQFAGDVRDSVEADSINGEMYVEKIVNLVIYLTEASGRMFEQEHFRRINMVSAINTGGSGNT